MQVYGGQGDARFLRFWRQDAKLPSRKAESFRPFRCLVCRAKHPAAFAAQDPIHSLLMLPCEHQSSLPLLCRGGQRWRLLAVSFPQVLTLPLCYSAVWEVEGNSSHTLPCLPMALRTHRPNFSLSPLSKTRHPKFPAPLASPSLIPQSPGSCHSNGWLSRAGQLFRESSEVSRRAS